MRDYLDADVLVIGSGAVGLRAALESAATGARPARSVRGFRLAPPPPTSRTALPPCSFHRSYPRRPAAAIRNENGGPFSEETRETDVLVIGAGAAGAMAALEASRSGLSVTLVDKGRPGRSGATPVSLAAVAVLPGGRREASLGETDDAAALLAEDIVRDGGYLSDAGLVHALVADSRETMSEALHLGCAPFGLRPDGSVAL